MISIFPGPALLYSNTFFCKPRRLQSTLTYKLNRRYLIDAPTKRSVQNKRTASCPQGTVRDSSRSRPVDRTRTPASYSYSYRAAIYMIKQRVISSRALASTVQDSTVPWLAAALLRSRIVRASASPPRQQARAPSRSCNVQVAPQEEDHGSHAIHKVSSRAPHGPRPPTTRTPTRFLDRSLHLRRRVLLVRLGPGTCGGSARRDAPPVRALESYQRLRGGAAQRGWVSTAICEWIL